MRTISTAKAILLLEKYGANTPQGLVQAPPQLLKSTTINRYLKKWGLDVTVQLPAPQAHSNKTRKRIIALSKRIDVPGFVWGDSSDLKGNVSIRTKHSISE